MYAVNLLVKKYNVDKNLKDNDGNTALDWANENEYNDITAYLGGSASSPTIPIRENNNQNQDNIKNENSITSNLPILILQINLTTMT